MRANIYTRVYISGRAYIIILTCARQYIDAIDAINAINAPMNDINEINAINAIDAINAINDFICINASLSLVGDRAPRYL